MAAAGGLREEWRKGWREGREERERGGRGKGGKEQCMANKKREAITHPCGPSRRPRSTFSGEYMGNRVRSTTLVGAAERPDTDIALAFESVVHRISSI